MARLYEITSGWTDELEFILKLEGVPIPLTGWTITIVIHDSLGVLRVPGGTLVVDPNQVGNPGKLTYKPVAADFTFQSEGASSRQPYKIHFKVVDGPGDVVTFPNGPADTIDVYQQ